MEQTPIFQKSYDFYKHLYENLRTISKRERFTWGERCEKYALDILLLAMRASTKPKFEKRAYVVELSDRIDSLKVLLRLGDDLRILDHKKYIARSGELIEIGKMAGGWMKSLS